MSPFALALAIALHALIVLALVWLAAHQPREPLPETAIEVTVEPPKPPEPPKPLEPPKVAEPPAPAIPLGLRPPAERTAEKPTQVPRAAEQRNTPPAPDPPAARDAPPPTQVPPALPPTPTVEPPKQAAPTTTPKREEHAALAPSPVKPPPKPQAHAALAPPPVRPAPPPPRPELQPSPLAATPQRRSSAPPRAEEPSPSPFVNPADSYNRARISDNYLWQVVRKLAGYQYQARVTQRQGTTVVRIVIARDGRLLDVGIAQSSGVPAFDEGVLAGVRAGSPYAPLPPEIKGEQATFTLPLVSSSVR